MHFSLLYVKIKEISNGGSMGDCVKDIFKKSCKLACVILLCILIVSIVLFLFLYFFKNPLKEYFNAGKFFCLVIT